MFARKMISDGEPVGLAVYKAARYYGVEQSELASWLRGRKKILTKAEKEKQKWYWGIIYAQSEAAPEPVVHKCVVGQTSCRRNEETKFARICSNWSRRDDTGSIYALYYTYDFCKRLYATKRAAEVDMKKCQQPLKRA